MQQLQFYDNREAIEQLMGKGGLFTVIDTASRQLQSARFITDSVKGRGVHVKVVNSSEFSIAHYTGKLVYDASEIAEKNRDFVPPEMIETMRLSVSEAVVQMFTSPLTRAGNLTMVVNHPKNEEKTNKSRWSSAVMENTKQRVSIQCNKFRFSCSTINPRIRNL